MRRRQRVACGAISAVLLALATATPAFSHTDLTVVNWGGVAARAHMLALVRPFEELHKGYCQLKSNWADFLPRARNLNTEQSMSYAFVYALIFGQIHLT